MPVLVAWIGEMLLSVVGQMALSAMVSLGIGFVVTKVAPGVIDSSGIRTMFASAGTLTAYIGFTGVDVFITIILSAWAGRAIVDAATAHLVSKRAAS